MHYKDAINVKRYPFIWLRINSCLVYDTMPPPLLHPAGSDPCPSDLSELLLNIITTRESSLQKSPSDHFAGVHHFTPCCLSSLSCRAIYTHTSPKSMYPHPVLETDTSFPRFPQANVKVNNRLVSSEMSHWWTVYLNYLMCQSQNRHRWFIKNLGAPSINIMKNDTKSYIKLHKEMKNVCYSTFLQPQKKFLSV